MEIQNENNLFKKFKQKMKIETFSKLIGVVILINKSYLCYIYLARCKN